MNLTSALSEDYFRWLCGLIHVNPEGPYGVLIKMLYIKEYYWHVPNDDNRASDGKKLRCDFANTSKYSDYSDIDGVCNLLEMLIALALRCESDFMYDPDKGDRTADWFWIMIKNLKLDKCTNESFGDYWTVSDVGYTLDKLIDRTYKPNGLGGLFPLKKPKGDQRKVEIWYQMSAYFLENY